MNEESMTQRLKEWTQKHEDEFLEFKRIPLETRKHSRPDLCALLYLHDKLGGERGAIVAAEHDQYWLVWEDLESLTEEDFIYIHRCGICYDEETGLLVSYT